MNMVSAFFVCITHCVYMTNSCHINFWGAHVQPVHNFHCTVYNCLDQIDLI